MDTEKRSQLFGTAEPVYGLNLEHEPNGGNVTDSLKGFQQLDFGDRTLGSQQRFLILDGFTKAQDLFGGGLHQLPGGWTDLRRHTLFGRIDQFAGTHFQKYMGSWPRMPPGLVPG